MSNPIRPLIRYGWSITLLQLCAACFALSATFSAPAQDISLILNPSVTASGLNRTDVREIFSARKQYWDDGSKITVFVLDSNASAHQAFCRQVLQIFPYQLERLWNQIIYSGQGDKPSVVTSESDMLKAVTTTPGAIGYVYAGSTKAGVQEVSIP